MSVIYSSTARASDATTLTGHAGTVRDVHFSSSAAHSSSLLSVGAGDFGCRLWDVTHAAAPVTGTATLVQYCKSVLLDYCIVVYSDIAVLVVFMPLTCCYA